MNGRRSALWRLDGTIGRRDYFAIGAALMAIKMGLDLLVARGLFGREWTPFTYAAPGEVAGLFSGPMDGRLFFGVMLAIALPFLWCGVALTIRRLRSAGLPLYASVLFFAPMPMNLVFFLVLSLLPPRGPAPGAAHPMEDEADPALPALQEKGGPVLDSPGRAPASSLVAVLLTLPFAGLAAAAGVFTFGDYGWTVFVGIPFALPMAAVVLHGARRPRRLGECLRVGLLWLAVAYALMLALAFEGIVCLVMALPLALPIVLLGATVGYFIQRRPLPRSDLSRLMIALLATLPAMVGAEAASRPEAPVFAVRTAVEVDAPPDRVWEQVVAFEPIPEPEEWFFRTGVAYPIRAEIRGRGVGATRHCVFNTGAFVEPIEAWDEPRLLRFGVTSNPPPMREWNPIAEIHPPHLDGFLAARRGQFRLEPLPGGRTRLEGTTWYQHHLWPSSYWKLWSDLIIHRIHRRVLDHVARLSEAEATSREGR